MQKYNLNFIYPILFLLFIFLGVNNYIWLQLNDISPFWDESRHLTATIKYARSTLHSTNILQAIWQADSSYPPFFYLVSVPFCLISGVVHKILPMSNFIFSAILIFSVYKTGQRLFNQATGLLAAFMASMSPMAFGTSRMFLLDFSVTAMVSLSIYLLLATEYFSNRKHSILFGLSFGLGVLTKETFILFLLGPTIYIFYKAFSKANFRQIQKIINFAIFFTISFILSLLFYFKKIFFYFPHNSGHSLLPIIIFLFIIFLLTKIYNSIIKKYYKITILIFIFILVGLYFYNKEVAFRLTWFIFILKDQIGVPFFYVFLFCLPYFLLSKQNKNFLLNCIILPYCIFTFSYIYFHFPLISFQARFTMPYLSTIAIISASVILKTKFKILRIIAICMVVALGFINFFNITYGLPIRNKKISNIIWRFTMPEHTNWWLMHRPIKNNYWKVLEILRWIQKDMQKDKAGIGLLVNTDEINAETFSYFVIANYLPFEIVDSEDPNVLQQDYIITLSDPRAWHWEHYFVKKQYFFIFSFT